MAKKIQSNARKSTLKRRFSSFFGSMSGCMFNCHVNDAEARAIRFMEVACPDYAETVKAAIKRNDGCMNMPITTQRTKAWAIYESLIAAFVVGA